MFFSIIIPVYNVEEYLVECISSILDQTYKNFEVILVDDGSTDSSGKICDKYVALYDNFLVVHKENGGLSSAWVAGLDYVKGKYVCSIDSDDYVENTFLENIYKIIMRNSSDVVVYGYKGFFEDKITGYNHIKATPGFYDKNRIEMEILPCLINIGNINNRSCIFLSRINKIIKTELLLKNSKFYRTDINYGEDNMWTIPNILTCESIYVCDNYYPYLYRNNPNSITHSYNTNLWQKFKILDNHILYILNELNYSQLNNQVFRDSVFHAVMSVNNVIISKKNKKEKIKQLNEIITDKTVIIGLEYMNMQSCSFKEKIIIYMIKLGKPTLIYYYKIFRHSC